MKYRLVILAFVLMIAACLLSSTSASSHDAGAQGGCFPGTYLVVEGSGTQSLDAVTRRWISRYELR
jgi:hypothetical protein